MKKKILFTLVMTVSLLCVGVQAQEFRYGLQEGITIIPRKKVFPDLVFMPD